MEFIDLVKQRYSARRFKPTPVARGELSKCIEAARLAPSASNSQPWHFVVTDEPALLQQLAKATYSSLVAFNKFTHQAPVLVALVIEKPKVITQIGAVIKKRDFPMIDTGITAVHFCLQAAELGLGTCMLGWFDQKKIKQLLAIPKDKTIGLLIAVGYPEKNEPPAKNRKPSSEMHSYNGYKKP
ncbi:MAG TPA: nitroreductase family protein [Bacteroidales bacterium]|nr:nitroreductase family protein [Bacteroidales bacterium]